jgi:membrane protein involved in colicin uptake
MNNQSSVRSNDMSEEKTPEQIKAEAEAKAAEKAAEKAAKKEAADKAKADAKAKREADKQAAKDKRAADKQAKVDAKAAAKAAKEASKQPEQNGVRRPKSDTICGKAWAVFDELSAKSGAPATIGDSLKNANGIAEATVRTQYARWRKYHGISGRVEAPKPAETPAAS